MAKRYLAPLDERFIIEVFHNNVAINPSLQNETLYQFDIDDGAMVVNHDLSKSNNGRTLSYIRRGLGDNVLLQPTPFFFLNLGDSDFYTNSAFVENVQVPYKTIRLHTRSGFGLDVANDAGIALSAYINYGDRRIDLANFFITPAAFNAQFTPNNSTLQVDNRIYTSYVEFMILDVDRMLSTDNTSLQGFISDLMGLVNVNQVVESDISPLRFEISVVDNSYYDDISLTGAGTGGNTYNFERFYAFNMIQSKASRSVVADDLRTIITVDSSEPIVRVELEHNTQSLEGALKELGNLDYVSIEHTIQTIQFNASSQEQARTIQTIQHGLQPWSPVEFVPNLVDDVDTMAITVSSRISFANSGIDYVRTAVLAVGNPSVELFRLGALKIDVTHDVVDLTTKVAQNVTTIQKIGAVGTSVNVSSLAKTHFIQPNKVQFDENLFPLDGVSVKLGRTPRYLGFQMLQNGRVVDLRQVGALSLHIGEVTYDEINRENNQVIFRASNQLGIRNFEVRDVNGDLVFDGFLVT